MGETEDNKTNGGKTRQRFDAEFKKDAVKLVETGTYSIRQVAKDLGVSYKTLSRWVQEARREQQEQGATPDVLSENRRLRRENEQLRKEREILKRFSAFWVKETGEN